MDFQQKMIEYAKYGISVRTSSNQGLGYYMVSLTFGSKWKVQMPLETEGQKVMCAKIKEDGTYCYMTEITNGIQPIFELVDETIQYNEELEKKVELLKEKAEELKELFANKTYDELVRLEFTFKTAQEPFADKPKRSSKTTKKTSQKSKNGAPEENVAPVATPPLQTKEKKSEEVSEIDKKIAAAMRNKS